MKVLEALKEKGIKVEHDGLREILEWKDFDSDFSLEDAIDSLDDDGAIHSMIDGNIDIYTADLWSWAKDNYEYVDQAIDEGLANLDSGIVSCLQAGQYVQLSEEIYDHISDLRGEIEGLEDE